MARAAVPLPRRCAQVHCAPSGDVCGGRLHTAACRCRLACPRCREGAREFATRRQTAWTAGVQWCRDMRALQEAAAAGASSSQPRARERDAWVGEMAQRKGKLFDLDLPECIGRPVSIHSRARGGYRAPAALGHCPLRVVGLPRVLCSSPVRAAGVAREWGRASTRREQICSRRACRGPCPGP